MEKLYIVTQFNINFISNETHFNIKLYKNKLAKSSWLNVSDATCPAQYHRVKPNKIVFMW